MPYYHASPVAGLRVLLPHVSNHGLSLTYFSTRRENTLVYLSNAVEKYARETGFPHDGPWAKWGPYGFTRDGRLCLEEYYPHALTDTYQGVSGYIYQVEDIRPAGIALGIPFAAATEQPAAVTACERVPDALAAILAAEAAGCLVLRRYEEQSPAMRRWIEETMRREYSEAEHQPEYRHFLKGKFGFLADEK